MIIFPGIIGSIARAGKTVVTPVVPLTYGLTGDASEFDNRGEDPPSSTTTKGFILNANGTGTETVTLLLSDFSTLPNSITVSFSSSGSLSATTISGGSTKLVYVIYNDNNFGSPFSTDGGSLTVSGSGGNTGFASITAYPYNYSGF